MLNNCLVRNDRMTKLKLCTYPKKSISLPANKTYKKACIDAINLNAVNLNTVNYLQKVFKTCINNFIIGLVLRACEYRFLCLASCPRRVTIQFSNRGNWTRQSLTLARILVRGLEKTSIFSRRFFGTTKKSSIFREIFKV